MHPATVVSAGVRLLRLLCRPAELPGYCQLSWRERQQVNALALLRFVGSAGFVRWLAWVAVWVLAMLNLIWRHDWQGYMAAAPIAAGLLWAWPWVACARRRQLALLLGRHWPVD